MRRKLGFVIAVTLLVALFAQPLCAAPAKDITKHEFYPVFLEVMQLIEQYHIDAPSAEQMLKAALEGIIYSLDDPYTTYMEKEISKQFLDAVIESKFGGIGVHIELIEGYVTVIAPITGSPAEAAGLSAGDRIIEVDGRSIRGVPLDIAATLIRGTPGTPVMLKVEKAGTGEVLELVLIRDEIVLRSVEAEIICNGAVGYIKVSDFSESVASQLEVVLSVMQERGVKALLVDMRNNPGGLLGAALELSDFLIPTGAITHILDRQGQRYTLEGGTDEVPFSPVIYLVNSGTASAAEIVASAAQDSGSGHVVGTPTFGKGTVQQLVMLSNGDMLKLTTAKYLSRNGRDLAAQGVIPDTFIPETKPEDAPMPPLVPHVPMNTGDQGDSVLELQRALNALGYSVAESGAYTLETSQALLRFQKSMGTELMHSGVAEIKSIMALNRMLRKSGLGGFDYQLYQALEVLKLKTRVEW